MEANQISKLIVAKGSPSVSAIIPTFRVSPERQQNQEIIRKAITKVKAFLEHEKISSRQKELLLKRLSELTEGIDTTHLLDGIGLYLSEGIAEKVLFPFPVTEKISIEETFEIRDLLNLQQFLSPYYVLVIGKKMIRLFRAKGDELEEVSDDHFPVQLEEEYEYSPPSLGSSYGHSLKAFEKDKGILSTIHLRSSFKHVDDALTQYLNLQEGKIILAGTKPLTTDFENISSHRKSIIAKIEGSFRDKSLSELALAAWPVYVSWVIEENDRLLGQLDERKPNDVVYGIRNVWKAASESRGLVLLVEKDYQQRAFLKDNGDIVLSPQQHFPLIPDAVGEIVRAVYEKNGRVVFVERDKLINYEKIALLLRY